MIEIQLISTNLRREEMLKRISQVLDQIDVVSNELFNGIQNKIDGFKLRLQDIDKRTEIVIEKINSVKNWKNRATKVFSHYKYPQNEINFNWNDYQTVQSKWNIERLEKRITEEIKNEEIINSSLIPFDEHILKDKLLLFNIKRANKSFEIKYGNYLGRVPWERITSLGSLLLFNSSEVAYSKRKSKIQKIQNKKIQNEESANGLHAPPTSMMSASEEKSEIQFELLFDEAPQITEHLPLALPSLPGIADEFEFTEENIDKPVNSVKKTMKLPDIGQFETIDGSLPKIEVAKALPELNVQLPSIDIPAPPSSIAPPPPPPPTSLAPPPPPPPPASMLSPPPPPPPPLSIPSPGPPSPPVEPSPKMNTPSMDGRASLLESIRAAGGKVPRTTKERKIEKKKIKQEEASLGGGNSSGGDLMSDLMKRLSMRRDGISGNNKVNQNSNLEPSSVMSKISSMIPVTIKQTEDDPSDNEWE